MNIALFSDTYPPEINGVATSTFNLRKVLHDHGHNVVVVTTNPFSKKVTYDGETIRIPGAELKHLYGYRAAGVFNQEAYDMLVKFHPDICHVQTDAGIGIFGNIVASRLRSARVYTYHTMYEDYTYYATKGHFERFARNVVRYYVRAKSDSVTELIAPSEKIKDYLRAIGVDSYINVIPTGIEFSKFSPKMVDANDVASLKASFGISAKDFVVLSLGRVAKEKSIDVCLRGYADFLKNGPKVPTKMLIVGGGPALEDLKALAASLGIGDHVVFSGAVKPDQIQRYYALGDCFVSASITETQGLTFMEAMAAGLIVLARYDDNLQGTIADGKTGYFFYDEEDFKEKLSNVITLPIAVKKQIQANAYQAIDVYSMEHFYENIIEVYQRANKKNW
ncbi:MAG: Alpha-monoglucosyldiacylglycerol synthase [Tenericutes bacterium ADurb.BinA155]|jgi:1,2-diacylglycerol 3-alpha-glucosyltransferase|nr:MAG: Alpha-monoglucosyldiacylglycerol synthase [Tenericutes bacterium ADurb.BinA155]